MPERQPTDPCLLCQINPATKTNSHILSRFISTNFLGAKGAARKGFEISSETVVDKKPKAIQDSPKENYILCDECESYLSIIEGLASDTFTKWQEKIVTGEFSRHTIKSVLDIVECENADAGTIRLFIYSLFWRVSISGHSLFTDFKLAPEFEEEIRQVLMSLKSLTRADFLQTLQTKQPPVYPFSMITAKSFADETANVLAGLYSYDPYCLLVDRFSFMLFREEGNVKSDLIKAFSNLRPADCKIMVFSEELWDTLMVKAPIQRVADQAKKKLL